MNKLTAITKKNQSNVNKAVFHGMRYIVLNDLRDDADNMGDDKLYKKYDRMCANSFDRHLDYMNELPKREQKRVELFLYPK
jgi:hypothetical protein